MKANKQNRKQLQAKHEIMKFPKGNYHIGLNHRNKLSFIFYQLIGLIVEAPPMIGKSIPVNLASKLLGI